MDQLKRAYHLALLAAHPDKTIRKGRKSSLGPTVTEIKDAYNLLCSSNVTSAAAVIERHAAASASHSPRPAAFVSLSDFECVDPELTKWTYPCRCGGIYNIYEQEMETGQHIVGCASCSEVIWVGYEELSVEDVDHGDGDIEDEGADQS